MTPREQIFALVRGEAVAPKPIFDWPNDLSGLNLAEVHSPFGKAIGAGVDLNAEQRKDPAAGAQQLDGFVAEVRGEIASALNERADGIFYVLYGASAQWCTPMQYGGFYLERDRELLQLASAASLNVVYVAGDEEVYFDCVSDLPATVFGWDSVATGVTAAQMRLMREGLLLSADPESDLILRGNPGSIEMGMEARKTVHV